MTIHCVFNTMLITKGEDIMYGAIIGDVAGSYLEVLEINEYRKKQIRSYDERIKVLDKNYQLFNENSTYTDDTVLTVAIADAVMNNIDYGTSIKQYASEEIKLKEDKYGRSRFSSGFCKWVKEGIGGHSYGNGSAMRVGPIGYLYSDIDDVIKNAKLSAIPSHNCEEAINASIQVATVIFLAKNNYKKEEIKEYCENNFNMNFKFDINELRHNHIFSAKAIDTVDKAIFCFLISNDFEESIKTSLSIGGDVDTIASITGAISEAYYGVPNNLILEVKKFIPNQFIKIIDQFYETKSSIKKRVYDN